MKEAEYTLTHLLDFLQVLRVAKEMIPALENRYQAGGYGNDDGENQGLIANDSNLHKVAGVIDQTDIERLRRLIFRSTKGKSFMFIQEYDGDSSVQKAKRSVYIIMYWDGQHIRDRIQKICDTFSGERFELPDLGQIDNDIRRVEGNITDARNVLEQTRTALREQLIQFDKVDGASMNSMNKISTIYIYKMFLGKEKALY